MKNKHESCRRHYLISKSSCQTAYALCKNIDEADTPFVALTIELSTVLWTGDKRLKDGLQKQGFNHFSCCKQPGSVGGGQAFLPTVYNNKSMNLSIWWAKLYFILNYLNLKHLAEPNYGPNTGCDA